MMQASGYEAAGISHPLVDVFFRVPDRLLEDVEFVKGCWQPLSADRFSAVFDDLVERVGQPMAVTPGGSVSNTLWGLHILGHGVVELGVVGGDENGDLLKKHLDANGLGNGLVGHAGLPTGRVLCLVTPDAQRTFATCQGAAAMLVKALDWARIGLSRLLYLTGFEWESPGVAAALADRLPVLREAGLLAAFDLADGGVVERGGADLEAFVTHHVDVLFANEVEAKAFTGRSSAEAAERLGGYGVTAVVKAGEQGAYLYHAGTHHHIPAEPVKALDATGAGDMFAAGFLSGILKGLPMQAAGHGAAAWAARVVGQVGARLPARRS